MMQIFLFVSEYISLGIGLGWRSWFNLSVDDANFFFFLRYISLGIGLGGRSWFNPSAVDAIFFCL